MVTLFKAKSGWNTSIWLDRCCITATMALDILGASSVVTNSMLREDFVSAAIIVMI